MILIITLFSENFYLLLVRETFLLIAKLNTFDFFLYLTAKGSWSAK